VIAIAGSRDEPMVGQFRVLTVAATTMDNRRSRRTAATS